VRVMCYDRLRRLSLSAVVADAPDVPDASSMSVMSWVLNVQLMLM
jgi:hypothetical protein